MRTCIVSPLAIKPASVVGFIHLRLEDEQEVQIGAEVFHTIDKSGLMNVTDHIFLSALGSRASIFTEEVLNKENYEKKKKIGFITKLLILIK